MPKPQGEESKSQNHLHLFTLTDFLTDFGSLQALSLAWSLLRGASCGFHGCREIAIWTIETAQCLLRVKCPAKWGRCCLVTIYNLCNNMCCWYCLIAKAESLMLRVLVLPFSTSNTVCITFQDSGIFCSMRKCNLFVLCVCQG